MLKKQKLFILTLIVLFFNLLGSGYAQSTMQALPVTEQCGGENSASAVTGLDVGTYNVYVKLGQKDTTETVSLARQTIAFANAPEPCVQLGQVAATDAKYTLVGSQTSLNIQGELVHFYIASASTTEGQNASAPQLVFVSTNDPICDLTQDCQVMYQNQPFKLSAKKISLTSDSLRVGLLLPFQNDTVKKVTYSIDAKPVYETKELEKFNERYVAGGEHILSRTILLASGQSLSDSRTVTKGTIGDVGYLFQSVFFSQSQLLKIIGIAVVACVMWTLLHTILRTIRRRRLWKQTHIAAVARRFDASKAGAQAHFYDESALQTILRYRKIWLGLLALIGIFLTVTTYGISTFTVDGVSMFPTLKDKSVHPLIKLSKTVAVLNHSEYVPRRGTIVVLHKDENNLFDPASAQVKTYVVKRVLGLPGERIVVRQGKINVYNDEHKEGYEPDAVFKWTAYLHGSEHFNIDITLKDGELFVVGDHRDESVDSRFYGPVKVGEVVGKVL